MYFRFSQEAMQFFTTARQIFDNWSEVKMHLTGCDEETPSTDLLYALAAQIVVPETCAIPSLDFINFVHMKPGINGYTEDQTFSDVFNVEQDGNMIRINNINQYHPLHYYDKKWMMKNFN
jgi:hypothetical protein